MSKLTINIGLPASGKSTESEQKILREGNTVRVNKDLLRTMLHFDKFNMRNEGLTRDAARTLAAFFLSKGMNVIIDDTNLNESTKQSWVELGLEHHAKIDFLDMTHVPVHVCVSRDEYRQKKVGGHVIKKMALQNLNYLKGEKVVICDLDGTLCDIKHRLHFAKSGDKDWSKFYAGIPEDTPRREVFEQVAKTCDENHARLILVSARPETYRAETEAWLDTHFSGMAFGKGREMLIMREAGDSRDDTIVKSEIHEKYLKNLNIVAVFDDRPKVIRMWREKGLNVVDVGEGVEF